MKRFFPIMFVLALVGSSFAIKQTNSRSVPEDEDLRGLGHSATLIENLLTETANILGSTENGDDLNVDDITADDINADYGTFDSADITVPRESSSRILPIRAEKISIGIPAVSSETDSAYTTAANTTEQGVQFKVDVIPAIGRLIDVVIVCTDSVTHTDSATATTMTFDIGTASGGAQYISATTCDETDDIFSLAADGLGHIVTSASATKVFISGTPGQNWEDLVRGKWDVYVIYYDTSDL